MDQCPNCRSQVPWVWSYCPHCTQHRSSYQPPQQRLGDIEHLDLVGKIGAFVGITIALLIGLPLLPIIALGVAGLVVGVVILKIIAGCNR